jgi:hypothetical protein
MRRARREAARNVSGPILAGIVASVIVSACGTPPPHATGLETVGAAKAVTAPTAAKPLPYDLYTHCGIDEARIGNRYFQAAPPLSDGSGDPPAGWDNPYQAGTMTLVSATEAVFTDASGHRVAFKVRPGAKTFLRVCS